MSSKSEIENRRLMESNPYLTKAELSILLDIKEKNKQLFINPYMSFFSYHQFFNNPLIIIIIIIIIISILFILFIKYG